MKKLLLRLSFCVGIMLGTSNLMAVTNVKGLTVLVSFKDSKYNYTPAQIDPMMNQATGYTGWGNNGSVSQYFKIQTNNNVVISTQIIAITLNQNFQYYENTPTFDGGQQLANDVVAAINVAYPNGFTGLTMHPTENRLWMFAILRANPANKESGSAYGITEDLKIKNNGADMLVKHVAATTYKATDTPYIGTVCHELGHQLFGWPDLYINKDNGNTNLGHYCLMGSGGTPTNPSPISAVLRYKKGWVSTVTDITNSNKTYSITANSRSTVFRYKNTLNAKEYFIIEALIHGGYYSPIIMGNDPNSTADDFVPDQGLAIWYVDEDGGLDKPTFTPEPRIKLVQADGMDEMHDLTKTEHDFRGDNSDLFNDRYPSFNDDAYPVFRWKDGSYTGLKIKNVTAPAATMKFTVEARPYTITSTDGANGNSAPKGIVTVASGGSKTFTFKPAIGYVVNDVKVNGSSKGPITSYTFSNVTSNQTIAVTYKTTTTSFPSPWLKKDIGTISTPGISGYASSSFRIETYGSDIFWNSDNFHFIYQPLTGDGQIVARIAEMNKPNIWSKSGIMIRESLNADAKQIMLIKAVWNGLATQLRPTTGGGSEDGVINRDLVNVQWIKLRRIGSTFTTYYSNNGVSWILMDTKTISMSSTVYIGLCAAGATANTPVVSVYDNVKVTKGSGLPREEDLADSFADLNSVGMISAPNPFVDYTTITVADTEVDAQATVLDLAGNVIENTSFVGSTKLGANYPSGVYILRINNGSNTQTLRIIKQ